MNSSSFPKAAVIVIGNEILAGHTAEANIAYLARALSAIGIELAEARIVPDRTDSIVLAVRECSGRYDCVFTTGGIGPTHDDITTDSIAEAFGVPAIEHPEAVKILGDYYQKRGSDFNAARRRMARVPQGAELIENPISAAPGFRLKNVFVLAGVPNVMQAMFQGLTHHLTGGAPIEMRVVECRLLEGDIAEGLAAIQRNFADVDIGSYPMFGGGEYRLKLVLRGRDVPRLENATNAVRSLIERGCTP